MSGQMSNGEIEGVLASIRRLLRDDATEPAPDTIGESGTNPLDAWAGAVSSDVRAAAPARPARRLVLNPDAMVRPGDAASATRPAGAWETPLVLTDPASVPDPEMELSAGPDLTDDPRVAAWAAPLVLSDPVVLPKDGPHGARPGVALRPEDGEDEGDQGGDPGPGPAPEVLWRPVPRAATPGAPTRRPPSLEERIAELEAALARDEATLEPDGGDPAPGAAPEAPVAGPMTASAAGMPSGTGPAARDASGLQPRLGPAEVRAWIAAESLKAFGALPEEISGEMAEAIAGKIARETAEEIADAAADKAAPVPGEVDHPPGERAVSAYGTGPDLEPDTWPEMRSYPLPEAGPDTESGMGRVAPDPGQEDDASVAEAGAVAEHPQALPAAAAWDSAPGPAQVSLDADGPDGPSADVLSAHIPPADHAPEDTATPFKATPEAMQPPEATATDHGLDPAVAAAVRALVSDTIRAELRGPLGEDLTRNIRRLVRREWARLSAPND